MPVAFAPAVVGEGASPAPRLPEGRERRDPDVRRLREVVARQYGLCPSDLGPLGRRTLAKMAAHVESGMVLIRVYRVEE